MAVLRKIKGSTLMETLVATVLIVVVFMLASMIMNNLFSNSIRNSTRDIDAQLNQYQYLYINDKLTLPYTANFNNWLITVEKYQANEIAIVEFEAVNRNTNKSVIKQYVEAE